MYYMMCSAASAAPRLSRRAPRSAAASGHVYNGNMHNDNYYYTLSPIHIYIYIHIHSPLGPPGSAVASGHRGRERDKQKLGGQSISVLPLGIYVCCCLLYVLLLVVIVLLLLFLLLLLLFICWHC